MKTIYKCTLAFIILGVALIGLHQNIRASEKKPVVFVSILPQQFFTDKISGGLVDCEVMVPSGSNPATYDPTPKQMAKLSSAAAFLAIGVPFENSFLSKIKKTLPNLPIIQTQHGIPLRTMKIAHHHEGEAQLATTAEPSESAEHRGEKDPHVWLNPLYAKIIAENIAAELEKIAPENTQLFQKNLAALKSSLDALDANLRHSLAAVKGKILMVFHPAFGYFADAYGLRQEAIEIEGKSPSAKELTALIAEAKADGVSVIFVQKQFSEKSAKAIAEAIGGAVVPIDPLGKDYIANMLKIATIVKHSLDK